ncbi:DUF1064 domain-containing protein [Rhizobium lentis]|uniref:DUF1064 domain-containing protein n=1 Tax=Rhizobium lentis TaxID=1138194 RepID=UPI001C82C38F|nr:DUF1064 domain-containing protein [Rhizobium lentis]MBX5143345.1 DUF1064 domain-containing protein [Rhizobium lentis]
MTVTISRQEAQALLSKPKRSKYGNKKVTVDGIRFDSKREAEYYAALKLREKAGEVIGVELQRPFALLGNNGMLIATYKADFCFWDNVADRFRVIDVKGVETKDFKLKKKMMLGLLGINVEVIK